MAGDPEYLLNTFIAHSKAADVEWDPNAEILRVQLHKGFFAVYPDDDIKKSALRFFENRITINNRVASSGACFQEFSGPGAKEFKAMLEREGAVIQNVTRESGRSQAGGSSRYS